VLFEIYAVNNLLNLSRAQKHSLIVSIPNDKDATKAIYRLLSVSSENFDVTTDTYQLIPYVSMS
jgi:hypothetical protein